MASIRFAGHLPDLTNVIFECDRDLATNIGIVFRTCEPIGGLRNPWGAEIEVSEICPDLIYWLPDCAFGDVVGVSHVGRVPLRLIKTFFGTVRIIQITVAIFIVRVVVLIIGLEGMDIVGHRILCAIISSRHHSVDFHTY